jgi:ATP phosphoribosyltransferase
MNKLKIVLPKGRIYSHVVTLLNEAGFGIEADERQYLPRVRDGRFDAKLMKPQNIPTLVELGAHDIGFSGRDWVEESGGKVVEVMDLGLDPVRIVAAIPADSRIDDLRRRPIVVASEYERLTRRFLEAEGFDYVYLRTYGATEVFPPDDADMIVDNVASGKTLREHRLVPIATLLDSSTRLIANTGAMQAPWKREIIDEIALLLRAILDARERVMVEMNVPRERLDAIVSVLPCMRAPTVSPLYGAEGYAVKAAVRRSELCRLIPELKRLGACDILEYEFRKVLP